MAVEQVAQAIHARHHDKQGQVGVDAGLGQQKIDGKHGQHEHAAMGEIDDVQHAIDQRQTRRDQGVDATHQQAVDRGSSKNGEVHVDLPLKEEKGKRISRGAGGEPPALGKRSTLAAPARALPAAVALWIS